MKRFAFVGDVHANAAALSAALRSARGSSADMIIFLGDLLTYGVDVSETIMAVLAIQADTRIETVVLRGNHDQLYDDILESKTEYYDRLPTWIRESVDHNLEQLDVAAWREIRFVDTWSSEAQGLHAAHANPFGRGDWTYLNSPDSHQKAAKVLADKGFDAGVYGHTHREKCFRSSDKTFLLGNEEALERAGGPYVLNAGSIGQPRNQSAVDSHLLVVCASSRSRNAPLEISFNHIDYSMRDHVARLHASTLSSETSLKLASFFS